MLDKDVYSEADSILAELNAFLRRATRVRDRIQDNFVVWFSTGFLLYVLIFVRAKGIGGVPRNSIDLLDWMACILLVGALIAFYRSYILGKELISISSSIKTGSLNCERLAHSIRVHEEGISHE